MVEYKITSEGTPNIEGQADMVLAAVITADGEGANIGNVINGDARMGDMATALGKLVANVADQTDSGAEFVAVVLFEAMRELLGLAEDEAQE